MSTFSEGCQQKLGSVLEEYPTRYSCAGFMTKPYHFGWRLSCSA